MALAKPSFVQEKRKIETVTFDVAIIGHTTQASIQTYCTTHSDILIYHEDDSRTVTAVDAGIGFALTDLDNDAPPATLGFLIPVGDALRVVGVELVTNSIRSISMTAPMTALGTVTLKGAAETALLPTKAGSSADPSGVTLSYNIAFIADLTSLNIDEDAATTPNNTFALRVTYLKRQPV